MTNRIVIRPKVEGVGRLLYRCASCGQSMEPDVAVIEAGKSYHPEHLPEKSHGR